MKSCKKKKKRRKKSLRTQSKNSSMKEKKKEKKNHCKSLVWTPTCTLAWTLFISHSLFPKKLQRFAAFQNLQTSAIVWTHHTVMKHRHSEWVSERASEWGTYLEPDKNRSTWSYPPLNSWKGREHTYHTHTQLFTISNGHKDEQQLLCARH